MNETRCAWCESENGWERVPGVSHGICNEHAAQMIEEARKDSTLQREVWSAEDRVRRRWWRWLRTEPVPNEGKRDDQTRFSAWMFLGALIFAAGFVLASWVAHWRFAP